MAQLRFQIPRWLGSMSARLFRRCGGIEPRASESYSADAVFLRSLLEESQGQSSSASRQRRRRGVSFGCSSQGLASGLVVLLAALGCQWLLLLAARETLRSTIDDHLMAVARLSARRLDADAHSRLVRPSQLNGPEYLHVVKPLREILNVFSGVKYIYTVRESPAGIRFGVDAAKPMDTDRDGVIDQAKLCELYPDADPAMRRALATRRGAITEVPFTDKWGTFFSAFVPVYRRDGGFECLVGVDIEAGEYEANLAQMNWAATGGTVVAFVASLCVGLSVFLMQRARQRSVADVAANEEKLRKLYDLSPLGIVLSDIQGHVVQANVATEEIFGFPAEELRTMTIGDLVRPAAANAPPVPFASLWDSGRYGPYEVECIRGDGDRVIVRLNGVLIRASDGASSVWSIVENTTDRRRAEQAIRESSERLSRIARNVPGMIYQYRLRPDGSSHLPYCSAGIEQVFGMSPDDVADDAERIFETLHPDDRDSVRRSVFESAERLQPWRCEFRVCHPQAGTIWVEGKALPHRETDGSVLWHGHISDITHHKSMENALVSAARLDKLTGLPNRQLFVERLNRAIRLRRQSPQFQYAVFFLDFDRFKIVNDSLGHEAGDRLLVEAANRIRNCVRPQDSVSYAADGDTAARFGGDEFVILVTSLALPTDAETVAGRLLESLSQPYQVGTYRVISSASIGIVMGDPRYGRAEEVLRDADTAMYEAKAAGKGRYVVFDARMQDRVRRRMELEYDLRRAIDERQLTLHYQPIVSLQTGNVQRFESLVRWNHPTLGLIGPAEFVPVAEECDLVIPLGDWVLREACRQLVNWWRTFGRFRIPSISVNLSRQQLFVPDFVPRICAFAAEAGVEPNCVHLEITESSVMRDVVEARKVLYALKSMGFKLDLDDFGTGHSSLACLHEFPLDVLKIDRSFVMNLSKTRDFTSFFVAITSLAKSLGVQVVAEGVETAEQVEILRSLDCQFAQGYFFGRPAPADEVLRQKLPDGGVFAARSPSGRLQS